MTASLYTVPPAFAGLHGKTPKELFGQLPTPCYILDEAMLRHNGEMMAAIAKRTGCHFLLAQKAFSNYAEADSWQCRRQKAGLPVS